MIAFSTQDFDAASDHAIAEWNSIIEEHRLNPSLTPGWLRVAIGALGRASNPLSVLVGKCPDGRIAAVVPFYFSTVKMLGIPMQQLELGSNLSSYHAQFAAPGHCSEALDALLERAGAWDVFRANNVPLGSETATSIDSLARARRAELQVFAGERSPYLPINGPFHDFLATKDKKFRYKWRKRRETIESRADVRLEWFTRENQVDALLRDVLKVEEGSWKAAAGSTIAAREFELSYQRALLPHLAACGLLLANVLYEESRPIAYSVCCSHNGWVGHLKTSFDESRRDLSPGAFVIDACIERAFEDGASEFDFLGDEAPHKLAWTPAVREHADFFLFSSRLKPRVVTVLKKLGRRAPWSERQ